MDGTAIVAVGPDSDPIAARADALSERRAPLAAFDGKHRAHAALTFVVMIGVASFFADMVHEGAHSTNGTWLSVFGASALAVAVISGVGEWCGYLVRLVSGYRSDRTGHYWLWTIVGHVVNCGAVPTLALVGSWQAAAPLIVLERVGKGMRNPPRDAMLAHAGTVSG